MQEIDLDEIDKIENIVVPNLDLDVKEESKDSNIILEEIENTLTEYKYNIPMDNYISLVKEYRDTCIRFNRLLAKEKDRNRKFVSVKQKMVDTHKNEIKNMKNEIDIHKRAVAKCKSMVTPNNENRKNSEKQTFSDDNLKSIRDDIDHVIEDYFSGEKIDKIMYQILTDLTAPNHNLDFSKINIAFLDAHKITLLQRSIYKVVMATIETNSTAVISAITNTILRNQYRSIHNLFAKKILKASNLKRGVFKFFGDIFIEQEDGTRWSSFAITRFMGEYLSQINVLRKLDKELSSYKESINSSEDASIILESNEEYYEKALENRGKDRLIHQHTIQLSEEQLKFSEMKIKYDNLLEATTRTILEKRPVLKVE